MAIQQTVPIYLTLKGDGSATTFVFAVQSIFQAGFGGSVPFGVTGVIPSSVAVNQSPFAVTSATIDANGNITITFTSPPSATTFQIELDIVYTSGAASSSSPTVSQNVTLTGTSTVSISGTVSQNLTQVAGTTLGSTAVTNFGTAPAAAAVPGVNASVFAGTTGITATGSSLNVNITGGASAGTQYTGSPAVSSAAIVTTAASGYDGTNIRPLFTSTTGQLHTIVDSSGLLTVSGTVAVTQSTSPWVGNITQWASTVLGTPQTFGTAPTGVVIGTSSDLYVAGTRARSNQTTTAAGALDVNNVGLLGTTLATAAAGVQLVGIEGHTGVAVDGATGSAVPANALFIGGTDGTNLRALATDTSGNQYMKSAAASPTIVQAGHTATANTSTALANAFSSNNTAGNSIIVIVGVGSGTAPTSITDTLNTPATVGNSYKLVTSIANGATFSTYIYILAGCLGGANTVTVNTASSTVSSIIYEVSGLLNVRISDNGTNTGTSAQAAMPPLYPTAPGELAFQAIAIGTASQTITVGSGWAGLAQVNSTATPTGLFTLGAQYQINPSLNGVTPVATFTSEPWATTSVVFYATPAVFGRVTTYATPTSSPGAAFSPAVTTPGNGANIISITQVAGPTLLKAGGGNLYGLYIQNLLTVTTTGGTQYIKFFDTSTSAGAAAGTFKFQIPLPSPTAASVGAYISIPPGALALANFINGIVVSINSSSTTASTTGAAAHNSVFWIA